MSHINAPKGPEATGLEGELDIIGKSARIQHLISKVAPKGKAETGGPHHIKSNVKARMSVFLRSQNAGEIRLTTPEGVSVHLITNENTLSILEVDNTKIDLKDPKETEKILTALEIVEILLTQAMSTQVDNDLNKHMESAEKRLVDTTRKNCKLHLDS